MMAISQRRVNLDIQLDILRGNYLRIAGAVSPCSVLAVLKADAYGLGAVPIARVLRDTGVLGYGVAELREAMDLVSLGPPVLILGEVLPDEIAAAVENSIMLPVSGIHSAYLINETAERLGKRAKCHIVVDTGMGRLGVLLSEALVAITKIATLPGLDCVGIYSHCPIAYRRDISFTLRQLKEFAGLIAELELRGITFQWRHIANSDAINNFPESFHPPMNVVRTGINLYGSFETLGRRSLEVHPVLTLRTHLVAVRSLPADATIVYGCSYRAFSPMRVGTISAGYADGLPLALSNRGHVLVGGRLCPVLGRVSMDYTTIDLGQVPNARPGDEVICLGGSGVSAISVEDWAQLKGTHSYDVVCSIGTRVRRNYILGGL